MYFYNHKVNKDENEQAQLLEMCVNDCFSFRNGWCNNGINVYINFI